MNVDLSDYSEVVSRVANYQGVPRPVWELMFPIDWLTMYELGNKKTAGVTFKEVFTGIGIDHFSIDINGRDGAVPLDLRSEIALPPRDVVTNIGTSEHVHPNQEMCFRNIHNLSRDRMIHWVPYAESMPFHGVYGYELGFFEKLAALNSYKIEKLYITKRKRGAVACVSLRKTNNGPFKWANWAELRAKHRVDGKFRFAEPAGP